MQTLKSAIDEFRSILAGNTLSSLTDAQASAGTPAAWTRKQILGHLIDSASNNHHRFVRAQLEGGVTMPGYAQDGWVAVGHYQERLWHDLVGLWTAFNQQLLHIMETTPQERLAIPCKIGDGEPVTLEFLMVDYVDHMKHHLAEIQPL